MIKSLFSEPDEIGPLAVTLRDYQQAAIDGLFDWFDAGKGNPLVVVPTGGGKSLIIAGFIHAVHTHFPRERVVVLTHVRELIDQNYRALLRAWPTAPAGVYSAGLNRREHDSRILFAGIQSVYGKVAKIGWADLILVDEAHLIPRKGAGMYRSFLDEMRKLNANVKVIGLTATPFRTAEGSLTTGEDRMFDGVAYNVDLLDLIERSYLSDVRSKRGEAKIDTSEVHVRGGEFVEGELEDAAMADDLVARACSEIVKRGADRKAWLVFGCGVDHAKAIADELRATHGIECGTVFGETSKEERDDVVRKFRAGQIRCVVNMNVLTTGFDAPHVDLIALLRPTQSAVLYVQMVGRGLRTAEGKKNCLVLDFGGNIERHGPLSEVRVREHGSGESGVLAKECPECGELVALAAKVCKECGYEFAVAEQVDVGSAHAERPDEENDVLRPMPPPSPIVSWDVYSTEYRCNTGKNGKPNTLRVTHYGGFQERSSEWICFDHPVGSFPRKKANMWWRDHGGQEPFPVSVDEALIRCQCGELPKVQRVTVDVRGEWPKILATKPLEREPGDQDDEAPVDPPMTLDDLPF